MNSIKNIRLISSLEKIYDNDPIPSDGLKSFSMLKNEKKFFQVAVEAEEAATVELKVNSDFDSVKVFSVENVKSDFPIWRKGADNYRRLSDSGYYPDLLLPLKEGVAQLKKGVGVFIVELDGRNVSAGKHSVEVIIDGNIVSVNVEIIDAELDFGDFVYTCWFHSDCLMSYYGFRAFSEEYWETVESYLRTAADYGMNCVLTPVFTPPLDTENGKERPTVQLVDVTVENGVYSFNFDKLDRWIETAESCGIRYFELSHLYTQWGAKNAPKIMATVDGEYRRIFGWETKANGKEYKAFLVAFASEIRKYFEERALTERVFIHVSDEPNFWMLSNYSKASAHIHKIFDGYKIIDALSDFLYYKLKIVSNPVPANDHIDKFLGKVDNLWTYYCSAQKNNFVSNRFFCDPLLRTRIIGYQMFKFDIKGFLHWGYNFYYTRLSGKLVDPFTVTDAGGEFPSGDSFIVYPAADRTAYHSLRLKVFYDGLQDMAALNTLKSLTDKETCIDIIEEKGKYTLNFSDYPHNEEWLLNSRERANSYIKEIKDGRI